MSRDLKRTPPLLFAVPLMCLAFFAASLSVEADQPSHETEEVSRQVFSFLNRLAEPDPLSRAHASLDVDNKCAECHVRGEGVPAHACLDCHTAIAERMENNLGWHGKQSDNCMQCHSEHGGLTEDIMPFDHGAFNHDQAIWRLEGAHRDQACRACHVEGPTAEENIGWQFIDLPHDCRSCHDSPHEERVANDCLQCHTQETWEDTHRFDHETMTQFPLENLHRGIDCLSCHATEPNSDEINPHFMTRGDSCHDCHSEVEDVFSGARFAEVLGEDVPDIHHGAITCQDCHSTTDADADLSVITSRCILCHTPMHGTQVHQVAALIEETLVEMQRDGQGQITEGPFAGLSHADLMHNPRAWLQVTDQ